MDGETQTRASVDAGELDAARFGFHAAHPHRSAKRRLEIGQALWLGAIIALLVLALIAAPGPALTALHAVALAAFALIILLRLLAADRLTRARARVAEPARWPVYTILCPLYREANVVGDLLGALAKIDYPRQALDIKLLIESDDAETLAAIGEVPAHIEIVIVTACAPRTKPKVLNIGLARARGEFLVVYDAEDRPDARQLRAALAAFEDGDETLACVQAPLAIDNAAGSWFARQFAVEYAIQFGEMLPLLARWRLPFPLGGTSNHFRGLM